jgi:GntR family transcriptional regulator, gluconate operon transcriptional repressor
MTTDHSWRAAVTTLRPAPALGHHIVDRLRRLIIVGELPAGTHLVEAELSQTFDVSRGPVRDALRQLRAEGLVESRRRGVFVIGLTNDDIDELYLLRQVLETEVVRLCMRREGLDLSPVRAAVDRMKAAAAEEDPARFAEADLDFHSLFYALSGHRRLESIWQQYRPTFADMLSVTNASDRDLTPIYEDHVRLLDLIASGDEAATEALLREHIDGSHRRMLSAYEQFVARS